ncbi:MAG: hypothetical protein TREMPRED_003175 [Tremellales sp. Tagirdzhanova-0007]|nr:MAG: hypothetical protein TREMPRED_003175 [Tremellales sp. Tagirdzhanova-0007]
MHSTLDEPEISTPSHTLERLDPASIAAEPLAIQSAPTSGPEVVQTRSGGGHQIGGEVHEVDEEKGSVVKLDELGPVIVNSDGVGEVLQLSWEVGRQARQAVAEMRTLSRIQNWQDLHPVEQERTMRLLVKRRNLARLQRLDGEEEKRGEEPLTALKDGSSDGL